MKQLIKRLDNFQYRHRLFGFVVAVVVHYAQDGAGRQALLITYYMFLSLFPLLLILSLFSHLLNSVDASAAHSLIHSATNYFPIVGQQLNKIAHSSSDSLSAMIAAGLVAIYGVRGVAMIFMATVNEIWGVTKDNQRRNLDKWLRGLMVVIIGGFGFITTSIIISWAVGQQSHGNLFTAFIFILSSLLLCLVFGSILKISLPKNFNIKRLLSGAIAMALALALLQLLGGFIVTHELRHYTDIYTTLFGAALGLIAWIYIVTRVLILSIEVTVVIDRNLWPVHIIKG